MKSWAGLLVLLFIATAMAGETNSPGTYPSVSRNVFGYDPTADFIAFDPQYREKHNKYVAELEALQTELARQDANGRATPCSRQNVIICCNPPTLNFAFSEPGL